MEATERYENEKGPLSVTSNGQDQNRNPYDFSGEVVYTLAA